jgi:nucleoside-diphosphate kinase
MSLLVERTLLLVKPDAVERGLLLALLQRIPLQPTAMRLFRPDIWVWNVHYAEHTGKPFFPGLIAQMKSGPVAAVIYEAVNGVDVIRQLALQLRAEFGTAGPRNLLHASDSLASADRELKLWVPLI